MRPLLFLVVSPLASCPTVTLGGRGDINAGGDHRLITGSAGRTSAIHAGRTHPDVKVLVIDGEPQDVTYNRYFPPEPRPPPSGCATGAASNGAR